MVGVYWMHAAGYCGEGQSAARVVLPFYVNAFFFVSGYLFFGKWLRQGASREDCRRRAANVLFKIMIPTMIFAALMFGPKLLMHAQGATLVSFVTDVFGGVSYWFTPAIAVAQLFFIALVALCGKFNIWWCTGVSAVAFALCSIVWPHALTAASGYVPWYWQTGLSYTPLMALGGLYARYEGRLRHGKWVAAVCAVVYMALMALMFAGKADLVCMGISAHINALGAVAVAASIVTVIAVARTLPRMGWLERIGRNSILFYFFCGAVPASLAALFMRVCPGLTPLALSTTVTLVSLLTAYALMLLILRHLPCLTDLRLLHK